MGAQVSRMLIAFGSLGLLAMTAIISWQVFGRFVLNSSPSWTEQASLVLMIWYVMFAAAAGVHEGFHIRIGLIEERLGGVQFLQLFGQADHAARSSLSRVRS